MNYYVRHVINIPDLSHGERLYLLLAYDACDEEYQYYQEIVRCVFPRSSIGRIENSLVKKGHISTVAYINKRKLLRLNYKNIPKILENK